MGIVESILLFVIALCALLYSSDKFVENAEKIGLGFGISPFIIGVTIVAFGTSLPEMATSVIAVLNGTSEIVIGNVLGSNITNILLILGVTALVKEIVLDFDVMEMDMPILFGSAFLLFFAVKDLEFSYIETLIFLIGLVVFLLNSFKGQKTENEDRPPLNPLNFFMLLLAGVFVYLGAKYTVQALESIATHMSISPHIIAITVIALGTSLPELVVSISAIKRGNHAIAIGNILGSNIFNTFGVMGVAALFGNLNIPPEVLKFDLLLMLAATFLFGMMCLGRKVTKWEGAILLLFYVYFIGQNVKNVL